jgi:hypothetical protein
MIDKLDLRIPRLIPFSRSFKEHYDELHTKNVFHRTDYYAHSADLSAYGIDARLSLYALKGRENGHKLELRRVSRMSRTEIQQVIRAVFDVFPNTLKVARVDFAVDVPNITVDWCRKNMEVRYKRARGAITSDPSMGHFAGSIIETLYFGKRPNLIRIYDKRAQLHHEAKTQATRIQQPGFRASFDQTSSSRADVALALTRIERQIGKGLPKEIETLGNLLSPSLTFDPFDCLKITNSPPAPIISPEESFETRSTALFLFDLIHAEGRQAANAYVRKHGNGNTKKIWNKYDSLLVGTADDAGLNDERLREMFSMSLISQLAGGMKTDSYKLAA